MKSAALLLSVMMIVFSACTKKQDDTKLTAFSTEAFAYGMDDSSEVDGTTRVKGFRQEQKNNLYTATLAYDIDLVTPKGDTVKSLITRVVDKSQKEKMSDTQLDAQFNLDSAYAKGKYKIIYRIKDVLSNQTTTASADFDLGD